MLVFVFVFVFGGGLDEERREFGGNGGARIDFVHEGEGWSIGQGGGSLMDPDGRNWETVKTGLVMISLVVCRGRLGQIGQAPRAGWLVGWCVVSPELRNAVDPA